MNVEEMTLNEIKEKGYLALKKELGVTGFIKFLSIFSRGSGNYVEDRKELQDRYDVASLVKEIKKHKISE